MTKTCTKCRINKSIEDFNIVKHGKYGVRGECRECQKLKKRERYKMTIKSKIQNWKPKQGEKFDAYLKVEKPHKKHFMSPFVCTGRSRIGHVILTSHFKLNLEKFYFLPDIHTNLQVLPKSQNRAKRNRVENLICECL